MKKFTFKMMMLAAVAMFAGTAVAQEAEEPVWYGQITAADYVQGLDAWTPMVNYTITYTADKHLKVTCTLSEFNNNNVQINFRDAGKFEMMNMVDGNNLNYEIVSADTYEEGEELNNAFFYLAYPNAASRANFTYVVGAENEAPAADEEAPVLTKAELAGVTYNAATLTVAATDNTDNVVVDVYEDAACETLLASQSIVADGSDQTVEVTGLTAETAYTFYVKAKDGAGNYSSEVLRVEAKTAEAPDLQEAVWYGVINNDTQWNMGTIGTTGYTPIINYTVTTTVENQLRFHITLSEVYSEGIGNAQVWWIINGQESHVNMNKVNDTEYETTVLEPMAYERGVQVLFRFRFEVDGAAPMTNNVEDYILGAENDEPTSGVEKLENGKVAINASNGCLTVSGAEGESVKVYAISGALVYDAVAGAMETIHLEKGIYVVVAGKEVKKIVL